MVVTMCSHGPRLELERLLERELVTAQAMDATKRLNRFAAECEKMANGASGEHERFAWRELAQRWRQCADTHQQHNAALQDTLEQKRRRRPRSRASRLAGIPFST